ncbi:MAG: mandelate racemase [Alphaproteobacteria bacterium]|nr:mandelate racemase [Alphaproteobacteria bacterium]
MTDVPRLTIHEIRLAERVVSMRLPFRFGSAEVRHTCEIYCQMVAEMDGRTVQGVSAQLMVPRWFDKRDALTNEDTVQELRDSTKAAVTVATGLSGTVATLSEEIGWKTPARLPADLPALAAGFGPALIEMALIDALCRGAGLPFHKAARADLFGLAAHLPPDVPAADFIKALTRIGAPGRVTIRHTVGFDAPVSTRPHDAPRDGLPVTLSEVIAATGISAWKIKLKGDPDTDAARLLTLQETLGGLMNGGVTLDANEQYAPDAFRAFLRRLKQPDLATIAARIRFFEQPFAREIALQTRNDFGVPLLIDESDDDLSSFATALKLGWSGTSIKSCKGVLRALVNMARAQRAGAVLSGEDLTCQPGLCWTQDTAMAAACGVIDLERNGHHFAGGLQGASTLEREQMVAQFPQMFTAVGDRVDLVITNGMVDVTGLSAPGFGASSAILAN